jgi:hypothetical protein
MIVRRRRQRRFVAVAVVLAALAGGAAIAGAVVPPTGTPDLADMALAPADFAPGSGGVGGYVKPAAGAVAQYDRVFVGPTTTGGLRLLEAASDISLLRKTSVAKDLFKDGRVLLSSRADLAALLEKGAGSKVHIGPANVTLGKVRSVGAGQQSLVGTFTVRDNGRTVRAALALVRVDKIVGSLTLSTVDRLPTSAASALTRTIAAHIATVLASVGSTGPSGPTGVTGATG